MPKQELIQISKEEYESMKETIEIMSNSRMMKSIKAGIEDIKKRKYISLGDFKKKHHLS